MNRIITTTLFLAVVITLSSCTTREMATGAAAGAAGYMIGHNND